MAQKEVDKLREKYKKRLKKSKKKGGGGIIFLMIIIVAIIGIFGYFKFIYESPESKEIKQKIGALEDEFRSKKNELEDKQTCYKELTKLDPEVEELEKVLLEKKITDQEEKEYRAKLDELKQKVKKLKEDYLTVPILAAEEGQKEIKDAIEQFIVDFNTLKVNLKYTSIAINELKKIDEDIEDLFTYTEDRIDNKTIKTVQSKLNKAKNRFDNVKLDLSKTQKIPYDFVNQKEELRLYKTLIKKPSKEEKKSLDEANNLYLEAEKKLAEADSIEDLDLIYQDMLAIRTKLVIFKTKLQVREVEWKEELSKIKANVRDFETAKEQLVEWRLCFKDIYNLWQQLEKNVTLSKTFETKEFNLRNLEELKKVNKRVDSYFSRVLATQKKFHKEQKAPDRLTDDCPITKKIKENGNTGPAPCTITIPPEQISDPIIPEVSSSELGGPKGIAIIEVIINEDGTVSDPKISQSSGSSVADEAAKNAAVEYRFKPGKCEDGTPGKCKTEIPILIKGV